jgi:RNA polymerase sigma-70 factor (ECF subfamily)
MMQPDRARAADRGARRSTIDERWYMRHRDRLMARCLRMVGNRQVAEDIVHETFTRAIADGLRRDGKSWGWLSTVARNLCIDHLRRQRRYLDLAEVEDFDAAAAFDRVVDRLDNSPERLAVADALDHLRDRERGVLWLRDVEGWDYADIANLEGITARQARNRAFRARGRVRERVVATLARALGGIAILRQLRSRSSGVATRALQRAALGTVAATLSIGGLAVVLQLPDALVPHTRTTVSLVARDGSAQRHGSVARAIPAPTVSGPGTGEHQPVTLETGTKHRRPGTVIPKRAFARVEVRDHEGNLLLWKQTSYECDHEGGEASTVSILAVSC